ncbi:MAG TPA: hypothetical protein VMC08_03145 [Bacteroidales bacterium]|nr:hypothetical protein [Bacteroidales bacterium]
MEGSVAGKTIRAFSVLGSILEAYVREPGNSPGQEGPAGAIDRAVRESCGKNPWFTPDHIRYALAAWAAVLKEEKLENWLAPYRIRAGVSAPSLTIGVVMAGNIPLAGFHDFLCVLASGHRFAGRLSSQDELLLPCLSGILTAAEPSLGPKITFTSGKMPAFDAMIATGSNHTSRYFEYYFRKYPHIIRKNRNGVAVLTGEETSREMDALGDDLFLYFGRGCRSVSKIYLPAGYGPERLKEFFSRYAEYANHHKYRNNYDYYKSVFLVNRDPFEDTGFLLIRQERRIASPVSVLFYETYEDRAELFRKLEELSAEIQCIVCRDAAPFRGCRPGTSQQPGLSDYADGVDTMEFLSGLSGKN